eukprot:gene27781-27669_t
MHFLTFFWKVLFAFCPPTDYAGGWACFCVALKLKEHPGALAAFGGQPPNGKCFFMPAGSLAFSVTVFVICAVLCLGTMFVLRIQQGAEPVAIFFVILWLCYILLSCFQQTYGWSMGPATCDIEPAP